MWPTVRDTCTPGSVAVYVDPNHTGPDGPVHRRVYGLASDTSSACIVGIYTEEELKDDKVPSSNIPWFAGRQWIVLLSRVAGPPETKSHFRWYFGNFSLKASGGRHADYYVRLHPETQALDFFPSLTAKRPVNTWTRIVPGTLVSFLCGQHL